MSVRVRTYRGKLSLVEADNDSLAAGECLVVPPSPRFTYFLAAAAHAGLEPATAIRLALERALVLGDSQLFDLDVESARRILRRAAKATRPTRPLTAVEAAYVRGLTVARPLPAPDASDGLKVTVPDAILTRARGVVPEAALHAGAVTEMITWEVAAKLEGRSMAEWALKTLAAHKARRRAAY